MTVPNEIGLPDHSPARAVGQPEITSLLRLAVAVVAVATLYVAQDVLIPIVLAAILSFVLSPFVAALERIGVPRAISVAVTALVTFCLIVLAGTFVARQASTLAADAPRYALTIQLKLQNLEALASSRLEGIAGSLGMGSVSPAAAHTTPASTAPGPSQGSGGARAPDSPTPVARANNSLLEVARTIVAPVLGPIETTVIVLVIAMFVLMEREDVRDRFIRLAGARDLHRTTAAMDDAAARLSRYFISQLTVNTAFGTVIALGLWSIGIPSPALWGALSGLLRFIPYVGPILAALPPLLLAAAVDPGWRAAVEVALLFVVVEPVTGYLVEPLLYGHSTGLAPIAVIVAAVFWTWMWGPVGLIISTPVTLCLVVMGRHLKSLEFFDVLLGDRPALTPVDTFYQRLLTGDPDDALERADTALQQQTLLEYYDDVVLQALQRAAEDEARGAITVDQATAVSRTMTQVFADLNDRAESPGVLEPATSGPVNDRLIACVAGRGPFDDAVSAMLEQLLEQRRVRTRRVRNADVSRERIGHCDLDTADAIIVLDLDMRAALSPLKYLVRRLRQRTPHARIIVGLRPKAPPGDVTSAPPDAIGADAYVGSLREALDACCSRTDGPPPSRLES
jgi:predicted PurR-regulated permease PerM